NHHLAFSSSQTARTSWSLKKRMDIFVLLIFALCYTFIWEWFSNNKLNKHFNLLIITWKFHTETIFDIFFCVVFYYSVVNSENPLGKHQSESETLLVLSIFSSEKMSKKKLLFIF